MQFDHATIVTDDIEATRAFLCGVVGLEQGPRPPFAIDGYWLYHAGRPLLHLVAATATYRAGRSAPRIDHLALRIEDRAEWQALIARLRAHRLDVSQGLAAVPQSDDVQLFVPLAPGVGLEFVTKHAFLNNDQD